MLPIEVCREIRFATAKEKAAISPRHYIAIYARLGLPNISFYGYVTVF
jgi:hypothetical protein